MLMVRCSNCGNRYPESGVQYRCTICGGVFDLLQLPAIDYSQTDPGSTGIWKYRHTFESYDILPEISLGEGNTPMVWGDVFGREVAFKCEYLNPTGSFKDRGSALLASFLLARGIKFAIEDSSGNAGASFSAYAARAGIKARIYVPDGTSGSKVKQIEMYGAEVVRVMGPRENAANAVRHMADTGHAYASHAYLPFNLPGYATLAYELVEQVKQVPGTVVLPVGQGGLFMGLALGFQNLLQCSLISKIPVLIGVQALACAPLWALSSYGNVGFGISGQATTIAEGISVRYPVRGDSTIRACDKLGAKLYAVAEEFILPGRTKLAKMGFFVEPTSAVVWNALEQGINNWSDPVVVILTGNGLKSA